jgi:hypothetical protein
LVQTLTSMLNYNRRRVKRVETFEFEALLLFLDAHDYITFPRPYFFFKLAEQMSAVAADSRHGHECSANN